MLCHKMSHDMLHYLRCYRYCVTLSFTLFLFLKQAMGLIQVTSCKCSKITFHSDVATRRALCNSRRFLF